MSTPRPAGSEGEDGRSSDKDKAVAKTAGFVVFSGIAISILKALNPSNHNNINKNKPFDESPPLQESKSPPFQKPTIIKDSMIVSNGSSSVEHKPIQPASTTSSLPKKTIKIVKGDTLWGLSRKHEVSIDALKEANGLTGDKIYAGKKLVIP